MHEIMNQNEWRVIGMSRSGNHAIINWLFAQLEGRACFLNCCEPKNNPFCWIRPMGSGNAYQVNYPDFDLGRERSGLFSKKDYLIYSHEDCFLGLLRRGLWEEQHNAWVGASESRRDILILRDPFNLFASRLKCGMAHRSLHTAKRIWKQHAREFLGERPSLPYPRVLISYNEWVRSQSYRRQLAEELGVRFSDRAFGRVDDTAGGSSFDGTRFRCAAAKMKVFDRWRVFLQNEHYRRIFDQEMLRLSEAIFGPLPAADHLL